MASLLMRSLRPIQCLGRVLRASSGNPTTPLLSQFTSLLFPAENVHSQTKVLDIPISDSKVNENIVNLVNNVIQQKEEGRLFAVVQLCGKQFKVTNNDIIVVEGYWPPDIGDEIRLEKVLLIGSADFTLLGRPILPLNQVSVTSTVIEKTLAHTRVWFKYIRRKQYRRIHFMKVPQTFVRINNIELLAKVNDVGDMDGTSDRIF